MKPTSTARGRRSWIRASTACEVHVALELGASGRDRDDLVDTRDVYLVDERRRVAGDHRDGDRPTELGRSRHELAGHVPHAPVDVLRDHEDAHRSFSSTRVLIRPAISDGSPSERLRALALRRHEHAADAGRRRAEIAGLDDLDLLLLGLLDGSQGRVAGLVDPGLDRQDGRKVDLGDVDEAALELPMDERLAALQLDLLRHGNARQRQQLGQRRSGCSLHRIGGLHAAEDQIRALAADHVGQRSGGRDRISRRNLFALDANPAIRAHRQGPPHGVLGVLVTHGDDDDLAVSRRLLHAERFLGCVRVPLVDRELEEVRVDVTLVVGELDLVAEHRDLLDAHDDLHGEEPSTTIAQPGGGGGGRRRPRR